MNGHLTFQGALVRGVLLALLLSVLGGVAYTLLAPLAGAAFALRGVVLMVAAGCLLELLGRSGPSAGRVIGSVGGLLLAVALLMLDPPLWLWCALPVGGLWLLRCLLLAPRPLIALLDAGTVLIGLAAALATARHTGSVGLAVWSLLLLQALASSLSTPSRTPGSDRFTAARHCAEAALQDLLNPRPSSRKMS